jgi:hypothetical protein
MFAYFIEEMRGCTLRLDGWCGCYYVFVWIAFCYVQVYMCGVCWWIYVSCVFVLSLVNVFKNGVCSLKSILFKNNPRNTIVERFFWGRLD